MTQVIVTRPEHDAASWVKALQAAGLETVEFPLLELKSILKSSETALVLQTLQDSQAVMFVSANAVRFLAQFLAKSPNWAGPFRAGARAWCTGPGTAQALLDCGISANQIDQPVCDAVQLDSEALWQVVANQVTFGFCVTLIRGADETGELVGRDWLLNQLEKTGAKVKTLAAYQRQARPMTLANQAQVKRAIEEGSLWVFSSSASIQALVSQCLDTDWSKAKAVVTHPRMALEAEKLGWHDVKIAPPGINSLVASIKSAL